MYKKHHNLQNFTETKGSYQNQTSLPISQHLVMCKDGNDCLLSAMRVFYCYTPGLGSSTVDQVLKYTKYPTYIPSTSTGQVLIF